MTPDPGGWFEVSRVVAFSETDAAGIVHFAHLLRYMEDCEHAYVRSLGASVHVEEPGGGFVGFPRKSVSATFHAPLRFEDRVRVRLRVAERRTRGLRYVFEVLRGDALAATGEMVVVCARRTPDGVFEAAPLPASLAAPPVGAARDA